MEQAAKRDPLFERTDKRLTHLVAGMNQLIAKHDSSAYKEQVVVDGKKFIRLVVSHAAVDITGAKEFEQVVAYMRPGAKIPVNAALIMGAQSKKFSEAEDFGSKTIIGINEKRPNDYLVVDVYPQGTANWVTKFYEKNQQKNTLSTNGNVPHAISYERIAKVYDGLTSLMTRLGTLGSAPDKPTA